jgi:hypothetical protein
MARKAKTFAWPAPVKGLMKAGPVTTGPRDAAEVLDNFIPTAEGARLRGGSILFATVPDDVVSLMTYRSGSQEKLFAATAAAIYDVTSVVDPEVSPAAAVSSLTSGEWAYTQFATAAGQYLVIANGADSVRHYNGTTWATPTITGVTSSALSFVWAHKKRLWFTEKNSLSAWYLDVNSVAGAATEFPLDGVFRLGGSLLFGGTWSVDAGDGMDDVAVFVTTEGEIAVYQGTDPGAADDWAQAGVYRIGRPLTKKGWFRAGGDIAILTEDGIVSAAAAVNKDRAALQISAITAPIEDLWQQAIATRTLTSSFASVIWPTKTIALIGVPSASGVPVTLVANTRTGAWGRVTGWDTQCLALFDDRMFFGTAAGTVLEADVGGSDQGIEYVGRWVPKFQEMNTTDDKFALHARATWRGISRENVRLTCFQNYAIGTFPASVANTENSLTKWGAAVKWGARKWGGSASLISGSDWQSVSGMGYSLSPALVVACNKDSTPVFELAGLQLRYETGRAI